MMVRAKRAIDHGMAAMIGLLGAPSDHNSSFERGAGGGPAAIRDALASAAGNDSTEGGHRLSAVLRDLGDIPGLAKAFDLDRFIDPVVAAMEGTDGLIVLGGDHAISYGVVRAIRRAHGPMDILHFDAHPDLYDELDGNRLSHACPFARILEDGLCERLVQVGIRTLNPAQARNAERHGVEIIPAWSLDRAHALRFERPVYVSIDVDVLDPAFAPGVSHPEPGGLATRELLQILSGIEGAVFAGDIVEVNPRFDPRGLTAGVGAKLVKALVDLLLN